MAAVFLAVSGGVATLSSAALAGVAVVVSKGSAVKSLSADDVKSIFLGKTKSFPGGGDASPCDQKAGSPARDAFYNDVVGKSAEAMKKYWASQVFTGSGTPPPEVGGDAEVKAWLGSNANGICYIDSSAVDGSVKVVFKG